MDHPVHGGWRGDHATAAVERGVDETRGIPRDGVRGRRVDNNNYYTRRSFANAVLRGWLGEGVEREGGEVGGRSRCRERSQAGEAEERMNRRGARGGRRAILKRDRYASLSRVLSSFSAAVPSLRLPRSPHPSHFLLFPHSPLPMCPLYTWPFVSPLRP